MGQGSLKKRMILIKRINLQNVIAPFNTFLLTPTNLKFVSNLLHNQRLNFKPSRSFGSVHSFLCHPRWKKILEQH